MKLQPIGEAKALAQESFTLICIALLLIPRLACRRIAYPCAYVSLSLVRAGISYSTSSGQWGGEGGKKKSTYRYCLRQSFRGWRRGRP
jgi:hypothetical protein